MASDLIQYELSTIMLGALSLGAVLAKGLLLGKEQINGTDTAFAYLLAAAMMVTFTHFMETLGLSSVAANRPVLIVSLGVIVLASLAIWLRLRTRRQIS